jgi:malate synthase
MYRTPTEMLVRSGTLTDDGTPVTRERCEAILREVLRGVDRFPGDRFGDAAAVFREVALGEEFPPFLTTGAYARYFRC